jgi:hypothetical protein
VTKDDRRTVQEVLESLFDETLQVDNFSEDEQLALAVLGIWRSMGIDVEAAVDKRAEIEAELASRRKLKGLSAEKVRELLRRAGDAVDQEASRDAVNL